jgi:hypothetical protein
MEWTHLVCLFAGGFVGVFLMTVWRNERRYRREQDAFAAWGDEPPPVARYRDRWLRSLLERTRHDA